MNGIITIPLVPLRANNTEQSEMTSQLLFGERVEIIESHERWLFVRNMMDKYEGWVSNKMIQLLPHNSNLMTDEIVPYCVNEPLLLCTNSLNEKMYIPGGSLLPGFSNGECTILDETYTLAATEELFPEPPTGSAIVYTAKKYLNAPFLWGGKTILGMDSSGLVQVVYSINGISLPRNASQQVDAGEVIDFLSEARAGDLAFFENLEGKIVHVGIMINSHQLIHVSGCVKTDSIDYQGIISSVSGEYSHKLRVIKRII